MKTNIYLDNAATTTLSPEVFKEMEPFFFYAYGNPSSSHGFGRTAKLALEKSRKIIAEHLKTKSENILFTASGTEADNTAILSAISSAKIRLVITSKLEHHAVLNTLRAAERRGEIQLIYLENDSRGNISLTELDRLLQRSGPALISLMHGNNEIGNLNPILEIADLAEHHGAIFHTDTVQTMGHVKYDTQNLGPDFLVGSAHKFHGPKGVGFLYAKHPHLVLPLVNGGSQEKGKRAGTENVAGIVGMAAALDNAYEHLGENESHILSLKRQLIQELQQLPEVVFNGESSNTEESLSSILSVSLPQNGNNLLNQLDLDGIYVSGGSACSGNNRSHVIEAIGGREGDSTLRFSFSRYNTEAEIRKAATVIKQQYERVPNYI